MFSAGFYLFVDFLCILIFSLLSLLSQAVVMFEFSIVLVSKLFSRWFCHSSKKLPAFQLILHLCLLINTEIITRFSILLLFVN